MKIGSLNGYDMYVPVSGGKAGKGHQVTSSIQIRNGPFIVKNIRFTLADSGSRTKAIQRAKQFATENPLP